MRPTTPSGSRTEKFTTSGPIGIEAPFISVTKPAKNSIWAAAIMASPTISLDGIAAVGGVEHGEFARVLAQDRRRRAGAGFARSSGATRRQVSNPAWAAAIAASTSSAVPSATAAKHLAGAGVDGVGVAAALRRMPGTAVVGIAVLGQRQTAGYGHPWLRCAHS